MSNDAPIHECESEIDHYTRHYVPYSLRLCVGSLTFHRFFYMCKGLWDGAYGLPSLSVLTNYACDFSQSETERYFEWIIIHHNQLLLAKFGKNFVILNRWRQNGVKSAVWFQVTEPLTEKTWRRGWVVLIVRTKYFTRFTAIYCLKTSREQQEDNSTDNICYLEHICWPEQTLIS